MELRIDTETATRHHHSSIPSLRLATPPSALDRHYALHGHVSAPLAPQMSFATNLGTRARAPAAPQATRP